MRIVLDTNVWISGLLLPKSLAGEIIIAWERSKLNLVTSQPILDELNNVLNYPKIQKRLQWNKNKIEQYLSLLTFFTEVVQLKKIDGDVPQDPNDIPILATLLTSKADYLVTGDNDLLSLKQNFSIITVTEFHDMASPRGFEPLLPP